VDRVIGTIRDAIGSNDYDFSNFETINKIVAIYNKTPHSSLKLPTRKIPFTPEEVNENRDLEGIFIRMNQQRLNDLKKLQSEEHLLDYRKGNILMIHLDYNRTPLRFNKNRRTFNHLAEFIEYEHGNAKVRLLKNIEFNKQSLGFSLLKHDENTIKVDDGIDFKPKSRIVTIPVYYTKLVSKNLKELPESFKEYFF
jgi:hypothetical protein